MFIRMLLPLSCLVGLILGFLILVSPFYITGGIVCWLDPVPPDAWLNHLLGMLISVFLGLVVIAGSGIFAVVSGIVFAVEAAANSKARPNAIRPPGGSNAPPAATELLRDSNNIATVVGMNGNSGPVDDD